MRRHQALQALSRQHHHILLAILLLEKGIKRQADLLIMDTFFQKVLHEHVYPKQLIEEEILFPILERIAAVQFKLLKGERTQFDLLLQHRTATNYGVLLQQVNFLKEHIRHLERVYYPLIEPMLTNDVIDAINGQSQKLSEACVQPAIKFYE